jgi:6-phosphogluconolactonase/glucosamine-6-phosphate isomerase/deaminase
LTVPALGAANTVVFLAVGADKADAIRRAFAETPSPATPSSLVRSRSGITYAFLDRGAAAELEG